MSFVFETDQDNATSGIVRKTAQQGPTGFGENLEAAWKAGLNERTVSRSVNFAEQYRPVVERLNEGVEEPGRQVLNPFGPNFNQRQRTIPGTSTPITRENLEDHLWEQIQARRDDGEDLSDLPDSKEELRQQALDKARRELEEAGEVSSTATPGGLVGGFLGGTGAAASDPALWPTFFAGAAASAGILRTAVTEAAIGGASEAALQPVIAQYREEVGLEYTREDFLRNVGFATAASGVLGGAIRAGGKGVESLMNRMQSDRGTVEAFDETVEAPTADERGARDNLDAQADIDERQPEADESPRAQSDHRTRYVVADKDAREGQEPQVADVPPNARRGDAPDPASGIERVNPDRINVDAQRFQFKAGAGPEGVTERLQGVEEWDEAKAGIAIVWEAEDGSQFIADGHQRVGLARRLREQGQDVSLNAIVLRESEGFSDAQARVDAAAKNIAEGSGSPVDAAKVIREASGEQADRALANLPPQSALVRQARGIANLADDPFGAVVNEMIPAHYGALVGRLVDDPDMQRAITDLLMREEPPNAAQAESIVRQARESGFGERATQEGLFGEEDVSQLLFRERAQVLDRATKKLRQDKRAFKTLIDQAREIEGAGNRLATETNAKRAATDAEAIDTITKLAHVRGPVSDALGAAATRAQREGRFDRAVDDFIAAIRAAGERGDLEGSAVRATGRGDQSQSADAAVRDNAASEAEADQQRLSAFDEPGGQGAQDQVADLDASMRPRDRARGEQEQESAAPRRDPLLDDMDSIADSFGVGLFVTKRGNTVTIEKIEVPQEQREQGVGSQAMQALTALADARGQQLALTPSKDFGSSVQRLRRFFKRYGFVNNSGRNKDFAVSEAMIRPPGDLTDEQQALLEQMQPAGRDTEQEPAATEGARDQRETPDEELTLDDVNVDDPASLGQLLEAQRELFDQANRQRAANGQEPFAGPEQAVEQLQRDIDDMLARPSTMDTIDEATRAARREDAIAELADRGGLANGQPGTNVAAGRRVDIVLGPPAAGKSSALVEPLARHHQSMIVDADEAKQLLPEYDQGRGANAVHEESSEIVGEIARRAAAEGRNMVYPKVGKTPGNINELIEEFRAQGYEVYTHMVDLPPAKTMQRMLTRYVATGRLLPPAYVESIGTKPRETFNGTKEIADGYTAVSNDVEFGEPPRTIEQGGGATLDPDVYPGSRGSGRLEGAGRAAQEPQQLTAAEQQEAYDLADMEFPVRESVDDEGNVVAETITVRQAFDEADADERFADELEACAQ